MRSCLLLAYTVQARSLRARVRLEDTRRLQQERVRVRVTTPCLIKQPLAALTWTLLVVVRASRRRAWRG